MDVSSISLTAAIFYVFVCTLWAFVSSVLYLVTVDKRLLALAVWSVPTQFVGFCLLYQIMVWNEGQPFLKISRGTIVMSAWFCTIPLVAMVVPLTLGLLRQLRIRVGPCYSHDE